LIIIVGIIDFLISFWEWGVKSTVARVWESFWCFDLV